MYTKKILKNGISINKENIITWELRVRIDESSLTGKNPPDDITVIAKFNELYDLMPKIFKIIKIKKVKLE